MSWLRRFEQAMNRLTAAENMLREGRFTLGWPAWEDVRRELAPYVQQAIPMGLEGCRELRWDDLLLPGTTVIVLQEGGAGDTFMTVRYAQRLAAEGVKVLWQTPPSMGDLLRSAPGIHRVLDYSVPVQPEWRWIRSMSLPARYGIWSPPTPYLRAPWWAMTRKSRAVGLRLKSGPQTPNGRERDVPAEGMSTLLRRLGDRPWVNLDLPEGTSWSTTAARIRRCQAIITVDTGVAHLAGALGVRTQLVLGVPADWRWGPTGAITTRFYPTVTQHWATGGDWEGAVSDALRYADNYT